MREKIGAAFDVRHELLRQKTQFEFLAYFFQSLFSISFGKFFLLFCCSTNLRTLPKVS